jgi:hypothetical protein
MCSACDPALNLEAQQLTLQPVSGVAIAAPDTGCKKRHKRPSGKKPVGSDLEPGTKHFFASRISVKKGA